MWKHLFRRLIPFVILAVAAVSAADKPASEAAYERAYEAWDTGDYLTALNGFEAILRGPDAGRFFERIALITGELYETREITRDGGNPRFSPDGRVAAYDSGARGAQVIHLLDAADGLKPLAEIKGLNGVFSPSGDLLAYLRVPPSPELEKLVQELAGRASGEFMSTFNLQRQLAYLEAKTGEIVLRELRSGREAVLPLPGFLKRDLAWSADGREVYFVGAAETAGDANEIFALPADTSAGTIAPRPLTTGPGFKTSPVAVPGGQYLVYAVPAVSPFPAPPSPPAKEPSAVVTQQAGQAAAAGQADRIRPAGQASSASPTEQPARPAGRRGQPALKFGVVSLADGSSKTFDGSFQAVANDGSQLAFIGREGAENILDLVKLEGDLAPVTIKRTPETIQSAAFSPDGGRLTFAMSYTRNNEIFLIGTDGKNEVRLSREIQHDRSPRFLSATKVLAVKGEPRHSRSYLYDTETLASRRLFHNNTIRTIAPEYAWVSDPTGTKLLIVADRDGDTMSPERGVYLVALTKRISPDALLTRLRDQRAAETCLRAKGESLTRPLASELQAVVSRVSTTRIYGYEETLFNFDSKHVTQPGNNKAADYIFRTLESFGYEPEYQWVPNRPNKTANVVATLKGTENPDLFYVVSAHYDSNTRCPGADDNTSATAVLLETARLLAGRPLPSSVIFAAFTGEEAGMWGSREFARLSKEKKLKVLAAWNSDMIGWTNDHRLDNTIRYSNAGIRDVFHAAAFGFSRLITYDSHYIMGTDATSLYDAWGDVIGGLGSYPVLGNPYYHQPTDLLETVNHQLLTESARATTAAVMLLASSPSPVRGLKVLKAGLAEVELGWTPNPEKGTTYYLVSCGPTDGPVAVTKKVKEPRVRIGGLKRKPGEVWRAVVKAVNARGLTSWDEAAAEIK